MSHYDDLWEYNFIDYTFKDISLDDLNSLEKFLDPSQPDDDSSNSDNSAAAGSQLTKHNDPETKGKLHRPSNRVHFSTQIHCHELKTPETTTRVTPEPHEPPRMHDFDKKPTIPLAKEESPNANKKKKCLVCRSYTSELTRSFSCRACHVLHYKRTRNYNLHVCENLDGLCYERSNEVVACTFCRFWMYCRSMKQLIKTQHDVHDSIEPILTKTKTPSKLYIEPPKPQVEHSSPTGKSPAARKENSRSKFDCPICFITRLKHNANSCSACYNFLHRIRRRLTCLMCISRSGNCDLRDKSKIMCDHCRFWSIVRPREPWTELSIVESRASPSDEVCTSQSGSKRKHLLTADTPPQAKIRRRSEGDRYPAHIDQDIRQYLVSVKQESIVHVKELPYMIDLTHTEDIPLTGQKSSKKLIYSCGTQKAMDNSKNESIQGRKSEIRSSLSYMSKYSKVSDQHKTKCSGSVDSRSSRDCVGRNSSTDDKPFPLPDLISALS